jgi:hypothetical protein
MHYAEQSRIVAKMEQLMAMMDASQTQLDDTDGEREAVGSSVTQFTFACWFLARSKPRSNERGRY